MARHGGLVLLTQVFVLNVLGKDGLSVDVSHFRIDSLLGAALIGHVLQVQNGYTVTIMDKSETPYREYRIDGDGKPIPML